MNSFHLDFDFHSQRSNEKYRKQMNQYISHEYIFKISTIEENQYPDTSLDQSLWSCLLDEVRRVSSIPITRPMEISQD